MNTIFDSEDMRTGFYLFPIVTRTVGGAGVRVMCPLTSLLELARRLLCASVGRFFHEVVQ
jgi:hypothetical protein